MAKRELTTTVIVTAPPGGDSSFAVLGPGDDVPDWAAEQIGDHAYEPVTPVGAPINVSEAPEDQPEAGGETPAPSKRAAAKKS